MILALIPYLVFGLIGIVKEEFELDMLNFVWRQVTNIATDSK
jgi:hypothetical protein